MKLLAAVVTFACVAGALALPGGAPSGACFNLMPQHSGIQSQPLPSPYYIDLSDFLQPENSTGFCYVPGDTYSITLRAMPGSTFRGLLIQGRLSLDGVTFTGTFDAPPAGSLSRLSGCDPPEAAVTHNNPGRTDLTSISFNWTAPANGTGPVQFFYSTVEQFTTFWVAEQSAVIQEQGNPLTPRPPPPTPVQATPSVTVTVGSPVAPTMVPQATPTPSVGTPVTSPPPTQPPVDGGATSLSGIGYWAILATAIFTTLKTIL